MASKIVIRLELKENGTQAVAYFLSGQKFVFDINKVRPHPDPERWLDSMPNYYPMTVMKENGERNKSIIFHDSEGEYPHGKKLFKAIMTGNNVNTAGAVKKAPEAKDDKVHRHANRMEAWFNSTTLALAMVLLFSMRRKKVVVDE